MWLSYVSNKHLDAQMVHEDDAGFPMVERPYLKGNIFCSLTSDRVGSEEML